MSEGTVRQWCRVFTDGRTNLHYEQESLRPYVVCDYLVQSVEQKICERRRFTIKKFAFEFPQISLTILYEIHS
jgi:hypothetical protein